MGSDLAAALSSRDALETELRTLRAAAEQARPPLPPALASAATAGSLQRLAAARAGLGAASAAVLGAFAPLPPRLPSYALQQQQPQVQVQGVGAGQFAAAAGYGGALPSAFTPAWPGLMANGGSRQVSPAVASTTVSSELAG